MKNKALLALALLLLTSTVCAQDATEVEGALPPVRAITRGPRFHWRAYYDKLLTDPSDHYVLCNEVDFEGRSPTPDDVLRVGMVDTQNNDRWIELGTSRAWNWQQGCMLQWVPGSATEVAWNDREGDQFVSHILDVKTGKRRTLPHPFYCLSPDGTWAVVPDFRRLNDTRPGYGYVGIPDPGSGISAPADTGIWRVDLKTGAQRLLFALEDVAKIPFEGPADLAFTAESKHWFNHLLINTDGTRFFFLHRWRQKGKGGFITRAFTASSDGTDLYTLIPSGKVSHFVWRDASHITAYAGHPQTGDWRFCVFEDKGRNVDVFGEGVLAGDGHVTYVPGTKNEWVLNDTYPDKQRLQHPHLFHLPTRRRIALGHFLSPKEYAGEWRCDLHPSCTRDGRNVLFDSPHNGGRQVYLADIRKIVAQQQ